MYSIDRWCAWLDESNSATISVVDGGITPFPGMVIQRIESKYIDSSKTYTLAAMTGDGLLVLSGKITSTTQSSTNANNGIYFDYNEDNDVYQFTLAGLTSASKFVWAALYEGSYTAETLPPYVPKGYAAELAECQRYYMKIKAGTNFVFRPRNSHSANYYSAWEICPPIIFPKPMRVKPSVEISYDVNDGVNTIKTPFDWSNQSCTMPNVSVPPGEWFDCNYVIASADL